MANFWPMKETIDLTILMPCLNEAETIARCIEKAKAGLQRAGVPGEILIADNGSTDGSQAIAAFAKSKSQAEPFDVVMMDLVIPNGVGGQDAVHTIKKIDPGARVIASSGHLEHPVMLDHKAFGFNAVLEKPYKLEKLQQVIEAVLHAPPA